MVLHNAETKRLGSQATLICKELAAMNVKWYNSQKEIQLKKMEDKLAKKKKNVDYVLKLAQTCMWGGPCCSVEELKSVLTKNPENDKKIVKTELAFYVHAHKSDRFSRPELFRLVSIDLSTRKSFHPAHE